MQFVSNQRIPLSWATVFTAVGLLRVSIGPPMSVAESGTSGLPSSSIRAIAAIAGTEGWQTAVT